MVSRQHAMAIYLLRNRILPLLEGDALVNSPPFILLVTNEEPDDDIAALNKTVSRPVGTTTISPIDTCQVLDVDGSDISQIVATITGLQDVEETLTLGDATLDLSGDASDTTTVFGVTFALSFVSATGVLTITQDGDDPFALGAGTTLLQSLVWGNTAVSPTAGARTIVFTAVDDEGGESGESTLTLNIYTPVVVDANGAGGGNDRAVTFTEAGSAVTLLDAAGTISGDVKWVLVAIEGVVSPAYEILEIDGVDFPLGTDADDTENVVVNSTTFQVQVITGSPISVLLTTEAESTIPQADMQTLLRSLEYRHTLEGPAEGDRVFTFYPYDANSQDGTQSTTTVTVEQTAPTSIAHTTAQAGPWETPSTWTAGVVPGAADTIIMTHHVTAYANQLFGHSPDEGDATKALFIGSGGQLTIADGVTVRVRGDVQIGANGAKINIGANSLLLFDNSLCSDPTTEEYQLIIGGSGITTAELISTGTASNPARIESYNPAGTSKNAVLHFVGTKGGKQKNNYFHFKNLGGTERYGIYMAGPCDGDNTNEFVNGIMEKTGGIYWEYALAADDIFRIQNVTFVDSLVSGTKPEILRSFTYGAVTTGERTISGNVFDEKPRFTLDDGIINDNIMIEGWSAGGFHLNWAEFQDNFVHWTDNTQPVLYTSPVNCYFAITPDGANVNAVHISIQLADAPPGKTDPGCYDCFFENTTGDSYEGGMIRILGPLSGPKTFRIEGNITVYHPDGQSGKLVALHGDVNTTVECYNNSCLVGHVDNADGHEQGFVFGENYIGHPGMVDGGGNLVMRPSAITQPGYMLQQENSTTTPSDVASWDYNGVWNLSAGSDGMPDGYNRRAMTADMFDVNVPGANDVDEDPACVDFMRRLAKWDESLGGSGTALNAIAEIKKKGLMGYNSAYSKSALFAYIREGWRPTNANYGTAGPGGGYIGAIQYQAPAGGGTPAIGDNDDLTGFADWEADMLSYGATYAAHIAANKDISYPGDPTWVFDNEALRYTYYDGERVYRNIAAYTGNNAWLTAAADSRYIYRRWLTAYGHAVAGYWKFTTGMRMAWDINNADATAIESINGLANYGAFSPDTTPLVSMEEWTVSRETAYTLINLMDQEWIGGSHRTRLDELLELIIGTDGHFDQWFLGSPPVTLPGDNGGEGDDFTPYQVALSAEALIQYWNEFDEDARILSKLTLAANWMWDNTWSDTYGQFYYRTDNPLWTGGSELNLVICPIYWWLYLQTGNTTHKARGDLAFNEGVAAAFLGPKQFNQVYRWTPAGLLWRAQADALYIAS